MNALFDFESVFEVDDTMYFYRDMLTSESTELQVEFLVRELEPGQETSILDLACTQTRRSPGNRYPQPG